MSEPNFDPPVNDGGQTNPTDAPTADKLNPAWDGLLSKIPDENLRKLITPELRQWDQNYNQGIEKVHSTYAPYKPFVDAQIDAESINNALLIMDALEQDPQVFAEKMIEHYGLQFGQGQEPGDEDEPEYDAGQQLPDFTADPEFQRYAGMTEQMAQFILMQHEQQQAAEEDAALDADLNAAREKHGDFDEDFVLQQMYFHGRTAEEAVQDYQQHVQGIVSNHTRPGSKAPIISGGGGGLPSQQVPVRGLDPQARKKLVAQILQQAHEQT